MRIFCFYYHKLWVNACGIWLHFSIFGIRIEINGTKDHTYYQYQIAFYVYSLKSVCYIQKKEQVQ